MYNLSEEKSGLGWMCKYSKFGNFAREDMSKVAWPVREGTSIQTSNVVRLVSFFYARNASELLIESFNVVTLLKRRYRFDK